MRGGYQPKFQEGMLIGRGFADLGYEAFLLLPGKKILSLFTAQVTPFPEEHRHFFFVIPSVDDVMAEMRARFFGVSIVLDETTGSLLVSATKQNQCLEESGKSPAEAILKIFIKILERNE
jgi:hypothetical protein